MLTGQRAQFEQALLNFIETCGLIFNRPRRRVQLVLGLACFDHGTIKRGQCFCQQRMGIRQAVKLACRRPDKRKATFGAVKAFKHRLQIFGDALALLHVRPLASQFLFLARLRIKGGKFRHRMLKPLLIARGIFQCFACDIKPHFRLMPRRKIGRDRCGVASAKGVKQRPVPARVQQPPVVMLAMYFHQRCTDIAQQSRRTRLIIYEGLTAAIGLDRTADQQRFANVDFNVIFAKQRDHIGWCIKTCGYLRLISTCTHKAAIGARAQRKAQSVQQDRLTSARLPG